MIGIGVSQVPILRYNARSTVAGSQDVNFIHKTHIICQNVNTRKTHPVPITHKCILYDTMTSHTYLYLSSAIYELYFYLLTKCRIFYTPKCQ